LTTLVSIFFTGAAGAVLITGASIFLEIATGADLTTTGVLTTTGFGA
tara:strand:+ start:835 stop:975 length:141 start_codon:yes stop_codon:yes gene_type:complete